MNADGFKFKETKEYKISVMISVNLRLNNYELISHFHGNSNRSLKGI